MKTNIFFSALLSMFSLSMYVQGDITDSSSGVSFPSQVTIDHDGKTHQLEATGVATRKKFFVKVYSVASYLENGIVTNKSDPFPQILEDNKAKQVTMKFVHEASAEKFKDGLDDSFHKVLSKEDFAKLKKEIDTYASFFNSDINVGDEHVVRWLPGGNLEVSVNGNSKGNITNVAFAKAVFSFWFGEHSVVNRKDLVKDLQ